MQRILWPCLRAVLEVQVRAVAWPVSPTRENLLACADAVTNVHQQERL